MATKKSGSQKKIGFFEASPAQIQDHLNEFMQQNLRTAKEFEKGGIGTEQAKVLNKCTELGVELVALMIRYQELTDKRAQAAREAQGKEPITLIHSVPRPNRKQ